MIYLTEHQIGFDRLRIAFPGLGGCAAIVVSTDRGMYGYHLPNVTHLHGERIREFSRFIDTHPVEEGEHSRLYFVTFFGERFGADKNHRQAEDEALRIARALGYKGEIRLADLSIQPSLRNSRSAYVEFSHDKPKCRIQVKPWRDDLVKSSDATEPGNEDLGRIRPGQISGVVRNTGGGIRVVSGVDRTDVTFINTVRKKAL